MSTWASLIGRYEELKDRKVDEFVQYPDGGWVKKGVT